jgi:hypothetical protein
MKPKTKNKEENTVKENSTSKKREKKSSKNQEKLENEDQNGIIPEGMDFKKFLGCGG